MALGPGMRTVLESTHRCPPVSKITILASMLGILTYAVGIHLAAQTSPQARGDAVNGLQMSISQDQSFQGTNRTMHLAVEFRNVGQDDETVATGGERCDDQKAETGNIQLTLVDSEGTPHRHLPFLGDGPPYRGGYCAGQIGPPFVISLHPGASVSIPLDLGKYLALSVSKGFYGMQKFHPGTYSLVAELPPWTSNTLHVHFDSEFAAPLNDFPTKSDRELDRLFRYWMP
jgi:hypothetical protein